MRLTLRVLALVSLVMFGLGLLLDVSMYQTNPCPLRFLFKGFLVYGGVLAISPALIGSGLAAWRAAGQRQWGWLAALLIAAGSSLVFLYGMGLDRPPMVVQGPVTALSSTFDSVLSLTTCGSGSSHYVEAAALTLVLLVTPLMLLSYSFSAASDSSGAPTGSSRTRLGR